MSITRRSALASLGGLAVASAAAPDSPRPLGINLYSVRDVLAKQPEQTLERLAAIGFQYVEVRPANLASLGDALKKTGLQPVHMMIESPVVTGNWEAAKAFSARMAARFKMMKAPGAAAAADTPHPTLAQMIELAVKHGLTAVGISFAMPEERAEPDGWERYAEQMNKAGLQCKAAGIGLYHHNHSVEIAGDVGKRPIDRLAKHLSKDVGFEIDVFWAAVGGADPATLINSLQGRIYSFHLKDRAPGTPVTHDIEGIKPEWFREIGEGDLNMSGIVEAAKKSGARYWFVEQDYSKRDSLESARISYAALRKLGA